MAKTGKFEHSDSKERHNCGENIEYSYGDDGRLGLQGEGATKMWYDEIKDYDFNKPGFSMKTGHFTQVVWKSSTKLGCGKATEGNKVYIVCHYCPAGNYEGEFAQNVLPPKKVSALPTLEDEIAEFEEIADFNLNKEVKNEMLI